MLISCTANVICFAGKMKNKTKECEREKRRYESTVERECLCWWREILVPFIGYRCNWYLKQVQIIMSTKCISLFPLSLLPVKFFDLKLHLSYVRCLATAHSCGKYTDTSNPPLKGIVRVLNPCSGRRIYSRYSLYKNFATPTLSVMTTAPRLSLGWTILRVGRARGVQTVWYQPAFLRGDCKVRGNEAKV